MSWILLATLGQFLNAVVAVIDKYIVTDEKAIPRPFVYAFYSCLMTGGWMAVFLIGFVPGLGAVGVPQLTNVQSPTIQVVGMSFLAAYTFFMALVSMFQALKNGDASDVMPVIGAVSALSTFALSHLFLDEAMPENFVFGIALLIVGTLLVSQLRFRKGVLLNAVHAGIFFAFHYIAMKGLFEETSFDDGFFWSRVSFVLFALSLLLVPQYLAKITEQTKKVTPKSGFIVLSAKIMAGVAAFMLLKATDLGDVTVVQALDALKYVFIIILSIVVGRFIPAAAGENEWTTKVILRKVLYICVIAIGFIFLFV